jgi:hypothetical protein
MKLNNIQNIVYSCVYSYIRIFYTVASLVY